MYKYIYTCAKNYKDNKYTTFIVYVNLKLNFIQCFNFTYDLLIIYTYCTLFPNSFISLFVYIYCPHIKLCFHEIYYASCFSNRLNKTRVHRYYN